MKKIITLIVAMATVSIASAQVQGEVSNSDEFRVDPSSRLDYGIKAGVSIASLDTDAVVGDHDLSRYGFTAGFFLKYGFTDKVGLLTELSFIAMGSDLQELHADYLVVPVLLNFNLTERLSLHAGPQLAIKTWASEDGFDTFDYMAAGGIHYQISERLGIEGRYNLGFNSVIDIDDFQGLNDEPDLTNQAVTLMLTYGFN